MDDPELPFDVSIKKKKRTKKTTFDPDNEADEKLAADSPPDKDEDNELNVNDVNSDFSNMKKKKKKKKPFDMTDIESSVPVEETTQADEEPVIDTEVMDQDLNFDLPMKKKKKKKPKGLQFAGEEEAEDNAADENEVAGGMSEGTAWHDTDRDYTYDELLTRVFDIMREKNPEMVAGEKKKFVMKPPQVSKAGAKKTAFANFSEICKMLHRQPKHLLSFLLAELGTSGSVDGSNSLIIKGRFHQKQLETVLRRYIKEYVTCHTCKSPETILQRDTRLYFLQCETCGSRCSVASIKSGFQAVTGKRAALRAKTN